MTDDSNTLESHADRPVLPGVTVEGAPPQQNALGGAYEAADAHGRELASWRPVIRTPDDEINRNKQVLDARGRDMVRNSGLVQGGVSIHRDSIVGAHYRLNARPDYKALGLTAEWAEAFQQEVESKFTLYAESPDCWIDASRTNTLTGLVRLAIGMFFFGGEVLSTVEWIKERGRPYSTAFQMVDPDRLSNPHDAADTETMRRGVERNFHGAPQAYHFRLAHPNDPTALANSYKWKRVEARKRWGRAQVIHIIEQMRPEQTRGVAEMVSVLKEMRMTKKFHEITLQNAVVNASYAAVIESELPPEQAFDQAGVTEGKMSYAATLLGQIAEYQKGARNLEIDGVKIPHLFPGTKLNLLSPGQPGGVGDGFEQSLLRHIAAALGLSYEQFSRDYTQTNYSSARASMNETWKYMLSRKKIVADRLASVMYACWLEEAINAGTIKSLPPNAPSFYEGQNKDAYCRCDWIGASRGQIDELKETQAAALRIKAGLSTYEKECAKLGEDFRDVFEQQAREKALQKSLGLDFDTEPTKSGTMSSQRGKAKPSADDETTEIEA